MRTTSRGIEQGSYITVRRDRRARDAGWVTATPELHAVHGLLVHYRSAKTGNVHVTAIANVRIETALEKRRKAALEQRLQPIPQPIPSERPQPAPGAVVILSDISQQAEARRARRRKHRR